MTGAPLPTIAQTMPNPNPLKGELNMSNDTRYPYTYAADYVRGLAEYGEHGTKLSRSDASQIRRGIALALGMDDAELAGKLADYFKANEDTITEAQVKAFAVVQTFQGR